jgi:hypothetical protein
MEIYPGADLIECEIVGRPLYLVWSNNWKV